MFTVKLLKENKPEVEFTNSNVNRTFKLVNKSTLREVMLAMIYHCLSEEGVKEFSAKFYGTDKDVPLDHEIQKGDMIVGKMVTKYEIRIIPFCIGF